MKASFEMFAQSTLQPRPPHKNKAEKLEDILETMKKRLVIDEINLGKILEDKTRLKKEYPEVVKLLQEVGPSRPSVSHFFKTLDGALLVF